MALTDLQRKQLLLRVNSIKIDTLLTYVQSGDVTMPELISAKISPERQKYIEEKLNSIPNPMEQKEWAEIEPMLGNPTQELLDKLNAYVGRWGRSRTANNHVDFAEDEIKRVGEQLEQTDWNNVDPFSKESLMGYVLKYPNTVHKDEIDDSVWSLTEKEDVQSIKEYLGYFGQGKHADEAKALLDSFVEWNSVKSSNDIFAINDYIVRNPDCPFLDQAKLLLMQLKQSEIRVMKDDPESYEVGRLIRLLNENVFTDQELIYAKVMTPTILATLRGNDIEAYLPDVRKAIDTATAECKEGFTDVFFFGVPSTGKTCVLMGLSCSSSLDVKLAAAGGDYAMALQQYTDYGKTVPPTPGTAVTTLETTINANNVAGAEHHVNLVEMSGEEFAFEIANNSDHVFTFEDMGSGATELLTNDNRKVFFLIIDPTTNVARFNREIIDGYDEETGRKITHLEPCVINQQALIKKMVDLFSDPGNAEIMKKVDAIHIIMTKADKLGDPIEREEKALRIFNEKYREKILGPIVKLCKEYSINTNTNFFPKLYTFSLGTFYVGGLYEYDQTDSDRLVKAIRNSTHSVKGKTWWDKFKESVN